MDSAQRKIIEELYFKMFDILMAYARSNLDNEALAEEAVQEAFRIACQKPEDLCGCPNPRGWLMQTLKYTIRNIQCKRDAARRFADKLIEEHGKMVYDMEDEMDIDILYENIADLRDFKIFEDAIINGYTYLEISQKYNITVSACKKRMERFRKLLRKKLKL